MAARSSAARPEAPSSRSAESEPTPPDPPGAPELPAAPAPPARRPPRPTKRRRSVDDGLLPERLIYFVLVPAIVVALVVLGWFALRTTVRLEQVRRQQVFDVTATLATERVSLLDKEIIRQDTAVATDENATATDLGALKQRWLTTAARETPTIRAILVVDLTYDTHDVLASASRSPGPDDDTFRRLLLYKFFDEMNLDGSVGEIRHLHEIVDDTEYLVSYWEHDTGERRQLVVARHDVDRIVKETMPLLYRDPEHGDAPMNVVDEKGRIVFGPPIKVGEFGLSYPFPATLNKWRLQLALASADSAKRDAERNRLLQLAMVVIAGIVAFFGIFVVITASIRERRLSALKSDFVANVSHELKTPLALIRMFGELLLTKRVREEDKREKYYQIIVSESERLTALIENVLDFARVERGKVAYDFVTADVAPIVARAVEVYRYRAEKDGVVLLLDISAELPEIRVDPRAIELSVMNLLDNALKYAKDGGKVEVSVHATETEVVVRIADHGPGIPSDEQARIFERFYRGKGASTSETRGSGIGLALVRHIAESHGGEAVVESPSDPDGRGTAFSLHLPRSKRSSEGGDA